MNGYAAAAKPAVMADAVRKDWAAAMASAATQLTAATVNALTQQHSVV
jgi:hypothetical protein